MTYQEIYQKAVEILQQNQIDSAEYDTRNLLEYYFQCNRISFIQKMQESPEKYQEEAFFEILKKRASGYPLQYILQSWTFMDREFCVGEGVLIPRDDTEVCVRECMKFLEQSNIQNPVVIDLCSGSGAIAVTLAKNYPQAKIYALELSEKAYSYLCRNIKKNQAENIIAIQQDIFEYFQHFEEQYFDLIISNPPYIKTNEITQLQKEIQYEPKMALDGGADGLDFYRCIAENWLSKLKKNGAVILEIGEEQGESVPEIFKKAGTLKTKVIQDIQNLDRTVVIQKQE